MRKIFAGVVLLLTICSIAFAVDNERAEYIRSHYAKFEYRIPMRDGTKLFTAVYIPYDDSKKHPILLYRTPYSVGPYGADQYRERLGPHFVFEKEGFIFVFQDVRGRYRSEGEYINMRPHIPNKKGPQDVDESTDTYDTIEWLLNHLQNHNGKVGQWGISYPGFYCSAGMIDSHPALKAVSPQAPIADWFWDDMHHHGAFVLNMAFNFFAIFEKEIEFGAGLSDLFKNRTPDSYQFFLNLGPLKNANQDYFHGEVDFWNKTIEHPNYDDFWQSRNILPHLKNISAATMIVGGWYDSEDLYGPLYTYQSVEEKNPGNFNILVMGPWYHGGWVSSKGESLGDADFDFPTSEYYQNRVDLTFFNHFLKDKSENLYLPEALVFETGANRWRKFDHWPPENTEKQKLYLHEKDSLSFQKPTETEDRFDSYISDPDNPVPYTTEIDSYWPRNYMTEDQRFASRRPDVLVYQSDVLDEDLTIAGPLQAELYVSTSGSASDWVVKVIDVYPNKIPYSEPGSDEPNKGSMQQMVRGEVFRGRFRESYEEPKPFISDKVTSVSFQLHDILHTFKRGHRIMIQIQSTWFPLVDRNPQKYVPNIFKADEEDFMTVTNRVYHSNQYPSHLRVKVLR